MIGLSTVGVYKGVKGKAPAQRNTFSKAKISELFGVSRAKKTATASTSEAVVTKNVREVEILNQKDVKSGVAALLPGEGEVGTSRDLIQMGKRGDNITPDHIPSAAYMKKFGVAKGDGIAMNMESSYPGKGGRHRQFRTYGRSASDLKPRSELAADLIDRKGIYQKDGIYNSKIRKGLMTVAEENKKKFPEIFRKEKK